MFSEIFLETVSRVDWESANGRLFHARGAATANARSPSDESVRSTDTVLDSADLSPARLCLASSDKMDHGARSFIQATMNHHAQLVVDTFLDGQPVTLAKQWCDVVWSWCVRDQSYGGIGDGLGALEVAGWQSCEHDVAVVQSTVYDVTSVLRAWTGRDRLMLRIWLNEP